MVRRMRFRQVISKLDLKSSDNLEWVLDTLEALDDTTILKIRLQARKSNRVTHALPAGNSSGDGSSPASGDVIVSGSRRNILSRRLDLTKLGESKEWTGY